MDELLYFLALVVGIVGAIIIWRYGRNRTKTVASKIVKSKDDQEDS
ncbi:hypothetical protein L1765_11505 [Microaerobacter geothermalis]|nr:hypothetical protein [Microaerobacter geothermalis]MCF6094589.1 hypothetical protein [Microaerobacter geothermalis]